MSSEKTVNSPAEMLAAMGGKVRDPWEEEEDHDFGFGGDHISGTDATGFRSKEENDRVKEIARNQIIPGHTHHTPYSTPNGIVGRGIFPSIGADAPKAAPDRYRDLIRQHPHLVPVTVDHPVDGHEPREHLVGDGEIAIAGHEIEGFADGGIEYHHPDPDVMGYLHSAFDIPPEHDSEIDCYGVDRCSYTAYFTRAPEYWFVEVNTENRYTCDEIHGDLADAVDHAKEEIRSTLTADLERLR